MDRSVFRLSLVATLTTLGCDETEETVVPPPAVEPMTAETVLEPTEDPAADRLKTSDAAKARIEALKKNLDPKLTAAALLESADAAYAQQNWKEARDAYRSLVLLHPDHAKAPNALHLATLSSFRLGEYSDGLRFDEDALELFRGTIAEARLLRVLGNTYLAIPHWGTKKGGELLRARWDQGIYQDTHKLDRSLAVRRLEEARSIFIAALADPTKLELKPEQVADLARERIDAQLDLASALVRFTPYDGSWYHWYYAWAEAGEDDLVDAEGADEHADQWAQQQLLYRAEPRGIEVDPDGQPVFEPRPDRYAGTTIQKVKFLLHEVGQVDPTDTKELAAEALLRQAMLFRNRDGTERLQRLAGWWWNGAHPYKAAVEEKKLWELADGEVYGLIATHLGVYRPPEDENVLALFRRIVEQHPKTQAADQAAYGIGLFYATRQQYDRALEALAKYAADRPSGTWAGAANGRMVEIRRPELMVKPGGVQLAGQLPEMTIEHRNTTKIAGRVRKLAMKKVVERFKKDWMESKYQYRNLDLESLQYFFDDDKMVEKYGVEPWKTFALEVKDDGTHRPSTTTSRIPVDAEGLYIVEARPDHENGYPSRALVLLENTAVVVKTIPKGELVWVVDAKTGQPVAGADVEVFEYWTEWKSGSNENVQRHRFQKAKTDERGLAEVERMGGYQHLITVRAEGRFAYAGNGYFWYYGASAVQQGDFGLVFTDRPVYRPENEVKLRVWARRRRDGQFQEPASIRQLTLRIHDPKGAKVFEESKNADEHGGADFTYKVPKGAPLGAYNMDVRGDGSYLQSGGNQFRVEEYKAPEFKVSVSVGDGPAKLGEKIPIEIHAEYYFGGAVEGGRVRYQVFRTDHEQAYVAPGPWDWLYGEGYGWCYYSYPWFGWWRHWGRRPWAWYPWWGPRPEPKRELVKEGEGVFGPDGVLKVELDTKGIKDTYGDADQRFVVKAEVRDASRRTITGEGEVIATRSQFFTTIETDRGYYRTGETMKVGVRTLRPDQAPLKVEGELRIAKVAFTGDNLDQVTEAPVLSRKLSTDDFGNLEHRFDVADSGQYRIAFVAKDAWGGEVVGSAVVWVWGQGFEGRQFKFNHLEVITDKRTYAIGETARLLISSDVADAHVLYSSKSDNGALLSPEMIRLAGKTKVVEVPITASHVPNFFVEATVVGAGRISEEVREIFVPPMGAELKVGLVPKKKENLPSGDGEVEVVTTTLDGQPVSANVAVSVFDSAVLYIQPEMTPDVRQFFWGQKRHHSLQSRTNLRRQFLSYHLLNRPDVNAAGELQAMMMRWTQGQVDFETALDGRMSVRGGAEAALGSVAQPKEEAARSESKADDKAPRAPAPVAAPGALKKQKAGGKDAAEREDDADAPNAQGEAALVKPQVRSSFADTAAWKVVTTNQAGRATVQWKFPDNLTTWRVKGIGFASGTRVGQATTEMVTTKKLLVRLQAPRFFRERDRVVISANVHNELATKKNVKVEIDLSDALLEVEGSKSRSVEVDAGGEARVDWWVNVKGEGEARVRVSALTDEESDAKELRFPVLVHGMMKTDSAVGSIGVKETGTAEKSLEITVPDARRPEQTDLVIRWSPTLAGAMMDALPYLLEYPYGCTEQTTSRFVPAVITKKALQLSGGLSLDDLRKMTRSSNPQQVNETKEAYEKRLEHLYRRYDVNPVYSQATMDDMIAVGLARLQKMQKPGGGWGWWGSDEASVYTTAYVLFGLHEAQSADVAVPSDMIARGRSAMRGLVASHLAFYREHRDWVNDGDAFFAYVMSLGNERDDELNAMLLERRVKLSVYGKSLLALALWNLGDKENANLVLRNAAQFLKEDPENETAWLETNTHGWWYWYNSDVESNAFFLRALATIRPDDDRAPKIVKWLLNNRKNGWYWRSTRDTAIVIAAFAHYMRASRFDKTSYDLDVLIDGQVRKSVHIDAKSLLTFDGELRLHGAEVGGGKHTITFRRKGVGAVYFNTYLSYFTLEEDVPASGLEIEVERKYYKLSRKDRQHQVYGQRGQATSMTEMAYEKIPLASGDRVDSGDLILVELMLESKNDYDFLAFEDPKPAGAEPVALRSGVTYGEGVANMELRDEKVVFFLSTLNQGKLKLDYRLRAEIPGTFHAMPAYGFAMYAPELRANSSEMRLEIHEE
jgi:hypothetical protein